MAKAEPSIYDAGRLAKFFGVSQKTIRVWCKSGKLPAFKIGKEWKVRREDLQKLINRKVQSLQNKEITKGMF
jgi:excisionase family DNA binding protein